MRLAPSWKASTAGESRRHPTAPAVLVTLQGYWVTAGQSPCRREAERAGAAHGPRLGCRRAGVDGWPGTLCRSPHPTPTHGNSRRPQGPAHSLSGAHAHPPPLQPAGATVGGLFCPAEGPLFGAPGWPLWEEAGGQTREAPPERTGPSSEGPAESPGGCRGAQAANQRPSSSRARRPRLLLCPGRPRHTRREPPAPPDCPQHFQPWPAEHGRAAWGGGAAPSPPQPRAAIRAAFSAEQPCSSCLGCAPQRESCSRLPAGTGQAPLGRTKTGRRQEEGVFWGALCTNPPGGGRAASQPARQGAAFRKGVCLRTTAVNQRPGIPTQQPLPVRRAPPSHSMQPWTSQSRCVCCQPEQERRGHKGAKQVPPASRDLPAAEQQSRNAAGQEAEQPLRRQDRGQTSCRAPLRARGGGPASFPSGTPSSWLSCSCRAAPSTSATESEQLRARRSCSPKEAQEQQQQQQQQAAPPFTQARSGWERWEVLARHREAGEGWLPLFAEEAPGGPPLSRASAG